uniref:Myb/SANT-like DNA-binding domain-containing protein n=1 Tax=Sphaeramia orbicularis TaxID=375764 RepID=A0A672YCU1_9TELE
MWRSSGSTPSSSLHKMKFEALELEVLVEEANKHLTELQQRNLNITRRNAIWEEICAKVNAVGKVRRTAEEVKKRAQDLRQRTKEKVAYSTTLANKTGDGPAEENPLSTTEQQVQLWFCDEQIGGLKDMSPGARTCRQRRFGTNTCFSDLNLIKNNLSFFFHGESTSEVRPSTSHSSQTTSAHSRRRPAVEDIDVELQQEQKWQAAALKDGLQLIMQELRSESSVTHVLRRHSGHHCTAGSWSALYLS